MLISHNWLKKYLPTIDEISKQQIADTLTVKLAEVESIKPSRQELQNIVVGEVMEATKIEKSKNLTHTKVKISDSEIKDIICGASNVTKGIKVAVCLPGGVVYNSHGDSPKTVDIGIRTLFEITSFGMICSEKELGISNSHEGIMILEPEIRIGTDLTPYLKDYIYEIENKSLSNRPDCFSHRGIAREISAILNIPFVENDQLQPIIPTQKLELEIQSKVEKKFCERFSAIVLSDAHVKTSPFWLKVLLESVNIRSINNIVDIANYIMLDLGQPLHTYDYDKVKDHKLTVRFAKQNEKVKGIDEKEYSLDENTITISSNDGVEGIAGIMGGVSSSINNETKNIIIEAANFNMYTIRKASRKLGLRTEASIRFEKGQDPAKIDLALKQTIQLMSDVANTETASEVIDYYPEPAGEKRINFDLTLVKRFLGIELSVREIFDIFTRIGCIIEDAEKVPNLTSIPDNNLPVSLLIPSFRPDLNMAQDLLEEIARIYGYHNFVPTYPKRDVQSVIPNKFLKLKRKTTSLLSSLGVDEVTTYSFIGKDLYDKLNLDINNCLKISNPISPEREYLRTSLLPSLIEVAFQNSKNYKEINVYERDRVVYKTIAEEGLHNQPYHIGCVMLDPVDENIFLKTKGIIEKLQSELSLPLVIDEAKDLGEFNPLKNILHLGRTATISLNSKVVGIISELHPKVLQTFELQGRIGVFEINIDEIIEAVNFDKRFEPISNYQSIKRDLSFWVNKEVKYSEIENQVNSLNNPLLKQIEFIDQYFNEENKSQKSITISITIQSTEKTLTDEGTNKVIEEITSVISKNLKAEFRNK